MLLQQNLCFSSSIRSDFIAEKRFIEVSGPHLSRFGKSVRNGAASGQ